MKMEGTLMRTDKRMSIKASPSNTRTRLNSLNLNNQGQEQNTSAPDKESGNEEGWKEHDRLCSGPRPSLARGKKRERGMS